MPQAHTLTKAGRIGVAIAVGVLAAAVAAGRITQAQAQGTPIPAGLSAADVAAYQDAARQHLGYLPSQVLVKFKDGVSRDGQQKALMALRSRPAVADLKWNGSVATVTDMSQANGDILAQQMREQAEVESAQPNYLRHIQSTPNDPDYASKQWDLPAIDLPRAWDINSGGNGITVAIVDTGVTNVAQTFIAPVWTGSAITNALVPFAINPDLSGTRLVLPHDFVTGAGTIILDTEGHGTHVSGTVGEDTNNGLMLAGIAYQAKIMPLKACVSYWDVQFAMSALGTPGFAAQDSGGCPDSATGPAIQYAADNGARVINFSIGGSGAAPLLQTAITYAVSKGAFVAIAAGNDFDNGNPVSYPAQYAQSINGAMAVAAVGRTLKHAYYSNSGAYVEIAAPGGDQVTGGLGLTGGIWQSTIRPSDSDTETIIAPRFDRFDEVSLQGTSMATPHVTGVAALIMSALGASATPSLVEQMIKSSARACDAASCDPSAARVGTLGRNDLFGVGLIQARAALFGSGLKK